MLHLCQCSCRELLFLTGESSDPVGLPGLAAVGGKRLFQPERGRCDVGKNETYEDGSALKSFLIVEFAATVNEPADHRGPQYPFFSVGPEDAPLAGRGVIDPQAEPFDACRLAGDFEFTQVGAPSPDFVYHRRSIKIGPLVRSA